VRKKILIIVGGGKKHLAPFEDAAKELNLDCRFTSFSKLEYLSTKNDIELKVDGENVSSFDVIYIRLVGKRAEDAALLVSFAKERKIRIVDGFTLAKSLELRLLLKGGIGVPKTYFGKLPMIAENAPKIFGFPFVIKETTGKQGHAVWSPKNKKELKDLIEKLSEKEKEGKRFIAQEFIRASQRNRILVIGGRAIAAITRPTRWRRRFIKKVDGKYPAGKREALIPIPNEDAKLAVSAAAALSIDIAGVDILHQDESGKSYVLEVNSAPRWESIKNDTGVNVEREIVSFLNSLDII